jgi:uncharacterized membrane protein
MRFQVPQFINVEDKIFGPLTTKQFFFIIGGAAIIFIMYVFLALWVVVLLGAPVGGFAAALAFYKVNGVPFIKVLNNALTFSSSKRLYLWKKVPAKKQKGASQDTVGSTNVSGARLTENKLQDLSWSLDIQQKIKR